MQYKNLFKTKKHYLSMNKWIELLIGLLLIVIAVYVWGMDFLGFGEAALIFLKGGIIWAVIGIGAILIMLGISDLKE
jgi:hypothetical protein